MGEALSPDHHHLVAIPFPGRGHINPMLGLCRHLASRGLLVTVVVTEEWLALLSSPPAPMLHSNIRLRSIPNVLPSEKTRGANYEAFIMAVLTKMGAPVGELVEGLDVAVDAVLADSTLPWAPEIGKRLGVPVSSLFPQSAALFLALHHLSGLEAENGQAMPSFSSGMRATCHPFTIEMKRKSFMCLIYSAGNTYYYDNIL